MNPWKIYESYMLSQVYQEQTRLCSTKSNKTTRTLQRTVKWRPSVSLPVALTENVQANNKQAINIIWTVLAFCVFVVSFPFFLTMTLDDKSR